MMKLCSLSFFLLCCYLTHTTVLSNVCTESKASSCGKCIAIPSCAWCQYPDYANNPNVIIPRCDLIENLKSNECPENFISNPKSQSELTMDKNFSNLGEAAVGSATQIKPQGIDVKLRPGDPVPINFAFKLVEDYPVDLYYMLDLSSSMKGDLNSLRSLGKDLGESMQSITKDLRMGFGSFVDKTVMPFIYTTPDSGRRRSFVDKTVMPFIYTTPDRLVNPCTKSVCGPAYSFHNDLPLTENIDAFVDSVNGVNVSSNIDHPEGGMDAMMQAVVCKDEIKWRSNASHLLVFSTDANFHIAGDGRLGGIVVPNDGRCYLDPKGSYTKANEMDYPSVGHLVHKITEQKIQPIFAVTPHVVTNYKNLQAMIPKSVVGELTESSRNIIKLIEDAYNDLKGQIIIEIRAPKGLEVSNTMAVCNDGVSTNLQCDGVKLRDTVYFNFSLSSDSCLDKPAVVQVSVFGYNDVLNITVSPQCECTCEANEKLNNCSDHGVYQCGACVCDSGFTGLDCSCDQKNVDGLEEYLKNCTDPQTDSVCNSDGACQCGKCICNQRPEVKIDGTYCQCDNTSCPREFGVICNNAGRCNCGVCECNSGWSGEKCECNEDPALCTDTSFDAVDATKPCNGNGKCLCGECECGEVPGGGKYRGLYCKTSPIVVCGQHKDCIQCLAFGTGNYNNDECKENCKNYNVTKVTGSGNLKQECRFTDDTDDCVITATYEEVNDTVMVQVESEKVCKEYINPMYVILGIIAGIVLIGLAILLIWKLLTSIKDAREFKNFQKESQNAKWQADENPIYKKATSTFRNPMYTGGKASGNL